MSATPQVAPFPGPATAQPSFPGQAQAQPERRAGVQRKTPAQRAIPSARASGGRSRLRGTSCAGSRLSFRCADAPLPSAGVRGRGQGKGLTATDPAREE
jgi:hypothetical protein